MKWVELLDISKESIEKFRKQEIDGKSLVLLTEEELLQDGIPGGPAIKIFAAIQKLAIKRGKRMLLSHTTRPCRSFSNSCREVRVPYQGDPSKSGDSLTIFYIQAELAGKSLGTLQ
jgi:hypothetical protein